MATITAALVKELRESTGAGMMDCKAALTENNGDIEASVDWLRKKGLSKAAKKAGRVAAEGLVAALIGERAGVVVEVNSETISSPATRISKPWRATSRASPCRAARRTSRSWASKPIPPAAAWPTPSPTAIANIGENLTLRRAAGLSVESGVVGRYVHTQISDGLGRSRSSSRSNRRATRTFSRRWRASSPCMSPRPIRWR